MTCTRGTSNSNERGSAEARRRSKEWLLATYAADVDVVTRDEFHDLLQALRDETDVPFGGQGDWDYGWQHGWIAVHKGLGRPAARCYRCGRLVVFGTMERDRIRPGAYRGRYVRENIRPCCGPCNIITGNELKAEIRRKRLAKNAKARERRAAVKAQIEHDKTLLTSMGVKVVP